MNYYNPYFYNFPIGIQNTRTGLLSRLFGNKSISFSEILNSSQKILNIANQTIPLVKQVKPVFGNVKTMFKVMNEFKKNDKVSNRPNERQNNISNTIPANKEENSMGPTFFI